MSATKCPAYLITTWYSEHRTYVHQIIIFQGKTFMKHSIYFIALLLVVSLAACGKPTAPESASSANYGTTLEGKQAEGRNEVK
jgi:hypothetical protein